MNRTKLILPALALLVLAAAFWLATSSEAAAGFGDEGAYQVEREESGGHVWVSDDGEHHDLAGAEYRFINHGHGRGFLGVGLSEATPELRRHLGAPEDAGVLISKVQAGSPAEAAGLKVGDVLTAVDGEAVASGRQVRRAVGGLEPNETVVLEVYRDGRLEQLTATVGEREGGGDYLFCGEGSDDAKCEEIRRKVHEAMERVGEIDLPQIHQHIEAAMASVHDVDLGEIHAHVREAMEGVDLEEIHAQVEKTLADVDWEEINGEVRGALDEVDWQGIQVEIDRALESVREELEASEGELQERLEEIELRLEEADEKGRTL